MNARLGIRRGHAQRVGTGGRRPWLATCLVVGAVLVAFGWSLGQPPIVPVSLTVVTGLVCVAAIARMRLASMGVALIVMFSLTASWDQASLGGVRPRMIFLILGFVLLVLAPGGTRHLWVPWWIHVYAASAIAVTMAQFYFPVSERYLDSRYLTSAAGLALGSRPGALPSLLSLLFNSYAVPLAIVLACAAVPRALRWIVTAYVAGAALSNLAGFLGFEGFTSLLAPLVTPPPAGVRALGYTSHPLHLATSAVLAVALACWLGANAGTTTKWIGRVSIVALFLGLYASGSRGGNAAGVAALALAALLLPRIRRRIYTVLAVAGVLFAAVVSFIPSLGSSILRTTRVYGGLTNDVSDTGRTQVFDQALQDFRHSPVWGIGVRYIAEAHVLYTGILASGGVILFLAYVAFNVGSFSSARKAIAIDRSLGGALVATILATLLYWSVADDFQVASVQIIYGLLLAALLDNRQERDPAAPPSAAVASTDDDVGPDDLPDGSPVTREGPFAPTPRRL